MVVKLYFKDGPRILDDHKKARGFIRGLQSYISEKLNGGIRIGTVCYFLDYTLERKALHDLGKLEKNLIEGIKLLYGEISGSKITFGSYTNDRMSTEIRQNNVEKLDKIIDLYHLVREK